MSQLIVERLKKRTNETKWNDSESCYEVCGTTSVYEYKVRVLGDPNPIDIEPVENENGQQ